MTPLYTATVKAPPSTNGLYTVGRYGWGEHKGKCNLRKKDAIKEWEKAAKETLQKPHALIEEKTAVACDFYVMKGDTDNRLKATLDLFNGEIWKDDKQLFDIRARKHIIADKTDERAEISVYSFPLSPITEIQRAIDELHPDVALTLLEGTYCALLQNVAALHKETALAARERLYALSGKACETA